MDKIINKIISQSPDKIPSIPNNINKKDLELVEDAIKKNMAKKVQSNILRLIAAQCYIQLDMNGYLKHLLDINFPQIEQQKFAPEARLRICEGIIQADELIRSHTVQVHLQAFDKQKHIDPAHRGRIQVIRSGLNCLQNNFYKAAVELLNASREECFVKDEPKKIQLINQSIAFALISPKGPQLHKLICSLYINEVVKRSELYPIVSKLYSEDMINNTDLMVLKKLLPQRMEKKDADGVSVLSRAMFSHNMLAIINSFSSISFKSATQLIGLPIDEMLLMIEKTYRNGEIEVDQREGYICVNGNQNQTQVKRWFDSIEDVLGQEL